MLRTRGLTHLALDVSDPERSYRFYRALLGVELVHRSDDFVQAQTPGSWDVLVFQRAGGQPGPGGGIAHFGFRVVDPEDVARAPARVVEAGGRVESSGEFCPGEPYVFLRDPDGHLVELWYELPTPFDPPGDGDPRRPTNGSAGDGSLGPAGPPVAVREPPDDLIVAPLLAAHWPRVAAIYAEGIATGDATFELAPPSWESWDAGHLPGCRVVALIDGEVGGWGALSPVSSREVYRGVAEVSVYVAAAHRGRGVGKRILEALVEGSEGEGIWTLQAAVFPENEGTLRLHRSLGFREVGRRERIGRMAGGWRDTVLLERRSRVVG